MKPSLYLVTFLLSFSSARSFGQNLLASPPEARSTYSSDITSLIDRAYPKYDPLELSKRLQAAAQELMERPDRITVRSLGGIEALMGLKPTPTRSTEVDTPAAYYRFDPNAGKAHAHLKNDTYLAMPAEKFAALQGSLIRDQQNFLGRLGLPADELMKVSFRKILVQDARVAALGSNAPSDVRRGMMLAYRGFAGFPIEGAFARLSSYTEQRVETFSLHWPVFKLHPEIQSFDLEDATEVKNAIASVIKRTAPTSDLAIYMGVTFQPVHSPDNELVYVPAMKVVVTPRAFLVSDNDSSIQSEGGLEFFASMLKTPPVVRVDEVRDAQTSL